MTNRRALAGALVVLGVVWIPINGPVEGPILVKVAPGHGLTTADLLSMGAFAVAAYLWFSRPDTSSRE